MDSSDKPEAHEGDDRGNGQSDPLSESPGDAFLDRKERRLLAEAKELAEDISAVTGMLSWSIEELRGFLQDEDIPSDLRVSAQNHATASTLHSDARHRMATELMARIFDQNGSGQPDGAGAESSPGVDEAEEERDAD